MPLTNPSSNSSANLAADPGFQNRVKVELGIYIGTINSEAISQGTLLLHNRRVQQGSNILQNLNGANAPNWAQIFALIAAGDASVISDATTGLTVDVTTGNAATQALLVTDTHISNAIAANFNGLLQPT
jgi:hypothetical protein